MAWKVDPPLPPFSVILSSRPELSYFTSIYLRLGILDPVVEVHEVVLLPALQQDLAFFVGNVRDRAHRFGLFRWRTRQVLFVVLLVRREQVVLQWVRLPVVLRVPVRREVRLEVSSHVFSRMRVVWRHLVVIVVSEPGVSPFRRVWIASLHF